mgnify:FL=1
MACFDTGAGKTLVAVLLIQWMYDEEQKKLAGLPAFQVDEDELLDDDTAMDSEARLQEVKEVGDDSRGSDESAAQHDAAKLNGMSKSSLDAASNDAQGASATPTTQDTSIQENAKVNGKAPECEAAASTEKPRRARKSVFLVNLVNLVHQQAAGEQVSTWYFFV